MGKEDLLTYAGIDLHKRDLVVAVENEKGPAGKARRLSCQDEGAILKHFADLRPFCAVIEASSSYRWLYELLSPLGQVILGRRVSAWRGSWTWWNRRGWGWTS